MGGRPPFRKFLDPPLGAQSTLAGAMHFCPKLGYVWRINKMLEFYVIFAQKLTKYRDMGTVSKKNISDRPFWRDFWGPKMLKNPNFSTEGAYSAYTAPRPSKLVVRGLDIWSKYARILHYVCQNFRDFFFGGGPLARGWAPGPPPAKSGPG